MLESPDYVQWMKHDHDRPSVALAQSPFFPNLVLSVSDWNFQVWKTDFLSKRPVFTSPSSSAYLTGGIWSPSRPGVLFLSRADGSIDVWDFSDSSHNPCNTLVALPNRITSMGFLSGEDRQQQLLAIGDCLGSLHVFEMQRNLSKTRPKEMEDVESFFFNKTDGDPSLDRDEKKPSDKQASLDDGLSSLKQVDDDLDDSLEEEKYLEFERKISESHGIPPS